MADIKLPPIPLPSIDTWPNTPEKLRARDIAVAMVVLEAAARVFDTSAKYPWGPTREAAEQMIRNLKVPHD